MESLPQKNLGGNEGAIDPRRKAPIETYARESFRQYALTPAEYDEVIKMSNSKEERLRERGLPYLTPKRYGAFTSVEEMRSALPHDEEARFVVSCRSKNPPGVERFLDASLDEACAFVETLPDGFDNWSVKVSEFPPTQSSGTILVLPGGEVSIEAWEGPHYLGTSDVPMYTASINPTTSGGAGRELMWRTPSAASNEGHIQTFALQALKYFSPIDTDSEGVSFLPRLPDHPVYAEYGVTPEGEIYFIDAADAPPKASGHIREPRQSNRI